MPAGWTAPRFVKDASALDEVVFEIKLQSCPHCRVTGTLIGHGFLRGYAERSSERVLRGRRLYCSNRGRRRGCGRTFSVKLSTVLCGFVVRTATLWGFAKAVLAGLTRRAAWLGEACGALSLPSGYRLWRRLCSAQSGLRVRLCRYSSVPACRSAEPLAQLFAHLGGVVGTAEIDLLAAFQCRLQQGLFDR